MIRLVAGLIMRALQTWKSKAVVGGGVGFALADFINIDFLRSEALRIAPGSDPEALEESARMAARLLGLAGDEVLWPTMRNGEAIVPRYFTIDLARGRAWYSSRHYSRRSVNAARRRGSGRGWARGRRDIATVSQAQGR